MDFQFGMFLSVMAQILPRLNLAYSRPSTLPPLPPPQHPTTTVLDLESQLEIRTTSSSAQSLNVIMAFCFTSVLEIALLSSAQPTKQHQLPLIFDLLSLAILLTFSTLFTSKFIKSRNQIVVQFLEQLAIFFSVTVFFVGFRFICPSTSSLLWAIYAVSLFTVWFSNKSDGVFFYSS